MKLKQITLISLFIFIAFFTALAVLPTDFISSISNSSQTTDITPVGTTNGVSPIVAVDPKNLLTLENIANHNTAGDCYLIVNDAVYNVSTYINQHPGGVRNITSRCGSEATKVFSTIHSNFAWNLLKKYYVGKVGSATTVVGSSTAGIPVSNTQKSLTDIEKALKKIYPNGEIVKVEPKSDFYVAKVIDNDKLYEVHISKSGEVIKTEVENDEVDWSEWDEDEDEDD
ncbi:MAG: hypothetical protein KBC12_03205 [Candidatus Pacebacteria bacterium]|nr:hypothetical protein [Candidatus Paceibacterota bacterium]MBP9851294.1 hypothetical protein [Candidatus Paceibacterota bacterium]